MPRTPDIIFRDQLDTLDLPTRVKTALCRPRADRDALLGADAQAAVFRHFRMRRRRSRA